MATAAPLLIFVAVLVMTTLVFYLGRQMGNRRLAADADKLPPGASIVQNHVSGLLALLLALGVSAAATRFDNRRTLIVDETNAIGTAYLRIDLLPAEAQPAMRRLFKAYLESRIETFRLLPDMPKVLAELERSQRMQQEIWTSGIAACRKDPSFTPATILFMPAVNAMIDLTTTRTMVSRLHSPTAIFVMLFFVMLFNALFVGYAMAGKYKLSQIHVIGFLVLSAVVFAVLLDLEYPRIGLLREASFDQALVDLGRSWR